MSVLVDQTAQLRQALEAEIEGEVRFDDVYRGMYATDASVYQIMPVGVVLPRSREDVIRVVKLCREYGGSITARGGGTSQAGQAIGAGIQLDFSRFMNRLVAVEADRETVTVEPGIVLDELNAQLREHGLVLPLDLSTSNRATIGGMIANNSSGTRSVVYGKTLDYVMELTVVMSDGSVMQMRPLGSHAVRQRCSRPDFDGKCHRIARDLATQHAEEIDQRYPKILRRVGGYNLDEFVEPDEHFNLSRLIVGSEGTLGLVVEAKLKLVPIPPHRILCVVQFSTLLEALDATPQILEHGPSAVEVVDRLVLNATRGKSEYEPLRDFIVGDPGAVLIIEFQGESLDDLTPKTDRLEQELRERQLGYDFHRAIDTGAQARIWKLRKAALGLSMSQTGDAKAISYVEDTAVAPGRLSEYISKFQQILDAADVEAGFYAHASVGLLHIRPVMNLKSSDGVDKFQRIAEQVSDLVLEFGGALSGEHGDGLARSPFQEKMFGPVLYDAFRQIKTTFDPDGLFNPGKIVDAPPITENLKFGAGYETRDPETVFDFSDFGGIQRAAEQCGGVGACRKSLAGTMCPSYMATQNETDSTRGRANALRLAISGQLGSQGLSDPRLCEVLDLCLECKACKTECPTGVDMARMKSEFLYQYRQRHGSSRRERFLAGAARIALRGSQFAPFSNWVAQNYAVRWLSEKFFGLDRRRQPPRFARRRFLSWWRRHRHRKRRTEHQPDVAFFADTFTNYYEPQHGIAAVQLAESFGMEVAVIPRVCCGRPLISKGYLDEARQQAAATVRALLPYAERQLPIVFCEPGCFSAVKDDHPHLLRGELQEQATQVAKACVTFEEWLDSTFVESGSELSSEALFRAGPERILLHGHCHQKALVGISATERLLSRIPECEVVTVDSGCCGMAGSFGYEREHYALSQAVGERKLLPAVRESADTAVVAAPGFSCRHQIEHFTGVQARSVMEILAALRNC